MLSRIFQLLKIMVSAALFTCLGIGGLLFTLLILPVLLLLPGGPEARRHRATRMIHFFFRLFVIGLEVSRILKVRAENLPDPEALAGSLIIANHPSYLDIVIILSLLRGAVCVVKEGVWQNPFYGPIVRAAGFVPIKNAEEALDEAEAALRKGLALVIFPEGTRTRRHAPFKFQRGVAHLALRTGAPILPLLIHVDPPLLEKGDRWYDVPVSTCQFLVRAEAVIQTPTPDDTTDSSPLKARRLTESLETFYQGKLHGLRDLHD